MTYGAYLSDSSAFGWVTPESTPMHFLKIVSREIDLSNGGINIDLGEPVSNVIIPFIQMSTDPGSAVYFALVPDIGKWAIRVSTPLSAKFTLRVYVFKTVIPQPIPKYGIAIFDSKGQCILTNETNPLRILEEITLKASGGPGAPAQTKTYSNKSIAVFPTSTGLVVGSITPPTGPPIYTQSNTSYYAVRQGANTFVSPSGNSATPGNINFWFNPAVKTYVIDTSFYD